jgi:hypothetical protein
MPPAIAEDKSTPAGLKPFALKWAEEAPAQQLWSQRSVFSAPVNGLDIAMVGEPENHETTGGPDMLDTTSTATHA